MTAVTIYGVNSFLGVGVKTGTATVSSGYTSNFGFGKLKGVVMTIINDDDAIVGCNITPAGAGTISATDDAGADVNTPFGVSFIAFGEA